MSQRREIEDRYTVKCAECKREIIYPGKKPNQKWLPSDKCPFCVTPLKCTKCGARGTIRAAFKKHVLCAVRSVTKALGVEIRLETEDCYNSDLIHITCAACNTYWNSSEEFLNTKPR
jgi:hypothetical protein